MARHIVLTIVWILAGCALLIALPDSVTSKASGPRVTECDAALVSATDDIRAEYRDICIRGYAIEGVSGKAYTN